MGRLDDFGETHSPEMNLAARISTAHAPTEIGFRQDLVMRAIVDHLGEGVYVINANRQIVFVNPAAEAMLGWSQRDLFGKNAHETFHYLHADGSKYPPEACPLAAVMLTGETARRDTDVFVRHDGSRFPVAYTAAPLRDGDQVVGAVLSFHDISERMRLEAERDTLLAQEQDARHATEAAIRERDALQALTDTALAHLDLDALLPEILDRVRAVMQVDNAAILLVDENGQTLRMRAVLGPETEVADRVVVQMGKGFAGRIAATREPLIVDDAHSYPAQNPFLRERLRSLLGVPLIAKDRALGVLHVGTTIPHHFTASDVALLQHAAARVAQAISHAKLYQQMQITKADALAQAQNLEFVLEAITDAVTVIDAQGRMTRVNEAGKRLLAIMAGPDFMDLVPAERMAITSPTMPDGKPLPLAQTPSMRVLRGETFTGDSAQDTMFHTRDGQEMIVSHSGAPLRDSAGRVTGGVLVWRDVTERRQMEIATRKQAERLNALMAANTFGLVVSDMAEIHEANDAFLQLTGYTRADLAAGALRWQALTTPEYADQMVQALAELREKGASTPVEKDYWRKDGSRVPVLVGAALLEREPMQWITFVLDLTEQKRLERERGQMLHIVGHELRTPLTSLKARIQVAQRRLLKTQNPDADLLAKADADVDRLRRLVDDLNEGAQLERGKFTLTLAPEDLVALCREVATEHERASHRHITLDLPKEPLSAEVDRQRAQQVIINLLNNAAKYTPSDARITLRLEREGALARISISDTGPGIPPDALPRLFERFYRVPGVETHAGSHMGLGLGLYIAQTLVQAHGGQMGVASALGEGTTFWFTLPLA